MKRSRLIGVAMGGAVLALLVILLGPHHVWDTTLSLVLRSEAKGLLEQLGLPEGVVNVSDISVAGPDGPMPEIATRSFGVRSNAPALRRFYRRRCTQVGLAEPDAESARIEPTMLCQGRQPGRVKSVSLFTACESETCRVTVEVRFLLM